MFMQIAINLPQSKVSAFQSILDDFKKTAKILKKKYRHTEEDIKTTDDLGISLKDSIYKVRIKNSDKTTGKSGGCRLLAYIILMDKELFLLYIYIIAL